MSKSNSSSVSVFATEAKELFLKCLEPNGEEARERLLEAADPGIRQEVRRLLKAREQGRVIDRVFNVTFAEDVEVLDLTPEGQPSSGNAGTNRGSAEGPGPGSGVELELVEAVLTAVGPSVIPDRTLAVGADAHPDGDSDPQHAPPELSRLPS